MAETTRTPPSQFVVIRDAGPDDHGEWLPLWRAYNDFYEAEVSDEVTASLWARIVSNESTIAAKVATVDAQIVGFTIRVLHPYTWGTGLACLMEDLYVDASVRQQGVGHALIDALLSDGATYGWERLYWHTKHDNATARRLYDAYTPADDFVRYRIALNAQ